MAACFNIYVSFFLACYLIPQISYGQMLKTFRCSNGMYVRNEWFCDGDRDCNQREDENIGCRRSGCGRGKFSCDNNTQCLNITVRCNLKKECNDKTDEDNCGDETYVKNCTSKDKFLCHDGLRCLDIEYTCDGSCNCFDCSDENENCSKTDEALLKKCPTAYFLTANGPQCMCDSTDDQNSPSCKNIKTCDSSRSINCDQRCIKYKDKMQCSCFEGYHIINSTSGPNGCRSNVWYGNVILYATMLKIKSLNVTSNNVKTVQSGIHNCTALFAANNYVYYATLLPDQKGSLFKSPFDIGKPQTIIQTDVPITSIAVDYITNNIYYTSNGSLFVCGNDGKVCTKLKCCGITYVAVAPKSGLLFYLQPNPMYILKSALVMKSNMDGSNETIFADDVYRGDISIVVDESPAKLYLLEWNEGAYRIKIDRISFDGEVKESTTPRNVRSLSVFNNDIFFAMDQKSSIFHSKNIRDMRNVNEDTNAYFQDNSTSTVKFLYAYNVLLQNFTQNPCAKASCSGLCLIKPAVTSRFALSYACLCSNSTSTKDNQWCSNNVAQAAGHGGAGVVTFILVFVVLGILSVTGYFMLLKRNWYQYYATLIRWQQNKRDQRIVNDDGY